MLLDWDEQRAEAVREALEEYLLSAVTEERPEKEIRAALADLKYEKEMMTPGEVARLFRVDPKTVVRWANSGKLTRYRTLGGHGRYRTEDVRALMNR